MMMCDVTTWTIYSEVGTTDILTSYNTCNFSATAFCLLFLELPNWSVGYSEKLLTLWISSLHNYFFPLYVKSPGTNAICRYISIYFYKNGCNLVIFFVFKGCRNNTLFHQYLVCHPQFLNSEWVLDWLSHWTTDSMLTKNSTLQFYISFFCLTPAGMLSEISSRSFITHRYSTEKTLA